MSGKSLNFGDKRVNKSNFYKNRKLFKIDNIDADKILVSRKNHKSSKRQLSTSLDIMIRMSLDYYV